MSFKKGFKSRRNAKRPIKARFLDKLKGITLSVDSKTHQFKRKFFKILQMILSVFGGLYLVQIFSFYFIKPEIKLSNPNKQWQLKIENNVPKLEFAFSAQWDNETIIDEILVYFPKFIIPEIHPIYHIKSLYMTPGLKESESIELSDDKAEILIHSPYDIANGKSLTYIGLYPAVLRIDPISRRKQPGNAYHTFWLQSTIRRPIKEFEIVLLFVVRKDVLEMGLKRFFLNQGPWLIKLKKKIEVKPL